MKINNIKPIPKYILAKIKKLDEKIDIKPCGLVRYYAYLTKNDGELAKVTCAVKVYKGEWFCKQVAVHGLHSEKCFCRDIELNYMGGYKVGFYFEGMRQTNQPKWFEDGKWYECEDKYFNPYARLINSEFAYKLNEFKYSACDLYTGDDIIEYLRTYEKYPQAEMLVKLGLSSLALKKQILTKIATDKAFRKFLGRNRDTLAKKIYYISSILGAYKQGKSIESVQAVEALKKELSRSYLKSVKEIVNNDYDRLYSYLQKENASITIYADYIRACRELNVDMTKDKNRYPHNLAHHHDIRIDEMRTAIALKNEQKRKEAEEEQKHLAENFLAVASKYMPLQSISNGAFVVYIAQSPSELIREGEALHHCVGKLGYDKKFAKEQSLIFFVRSATDTEKPLATIEYDVKRSKILQCYADHNQKPCENVMDYVNNVWLPHASSELKKIAA